MAQKPAKHRRGVTCTRRASGYVLRWREFSGRQRQQTVTDKRTAIKLQAEIRACLESGRDWIPPAQLQAVRRVPDLAELSADYLRDAARRLAPRTLVSYGGYLDLWTAYTEAAGFTRVDELSREALLGFWDWLRDPANGRHGRGRSVVTARKPIEVVGLMWAWGLTAAAYRAHLPPVEALELPRRARPRPVGPTWAEFDRMLAELARCAGGWAVRVAVIARFLGERRSAILRLGWDHLVDLDGRTWIDIPDEITKGGVGGRLIPLPEQLATLIEGWGARGGERTLVGAPPLELTGRGHVDRTLRRAWKRAGVRAPAWEGQPVHGVRVTIRSHLAAAGIQGDVIDAYIGHAGAGTGGRHYTDRAHLHGPLLAAVATLPPMSEELLAAVARATSDPRSNIPERGTS